MLITKELNLDRVCVSGSSCRIRYRGSGLVDLLSLGGTAASRSSVEMYDILLLLTLGHMRLRLLLHHLHNGDVTAFLGGYSCRRGIISSLLLLHHQL